MSESKDDPTELDLTVRDKQDLRRPSADEIRRAVDNVDTVAPLPPAFNSNPKLPKPGPGATIPVEPPRMFDLNRTQPNLQQGPGFASTPNSDPTLGERAPPPPKVVDLTPPQKAQPAPGGANLVPLLAAALIAAVAIIIVLLMRK